MTTYRLHCRLLMLVSVIHLSPDCQGTSQHRYGEDLLSPRWCRMSAGDQQLFLYGERHAMTLSTTNKCNKPGLERWYHPGLASLVHMSCHDTSLSTTKNVISQDSNICTRLASLGQYHQIYSTCDRAPK